MLENTEKTAEKPAENNTPPPAQNAESQSFVDSENGGIEDFRKVLNIPVEKPSEKRDAKTFDGADPFGEMLGGSGEEIEDLFDPEGEGVNELFEDSEALSEMCVELLDLGMNYASQAISMDWGQDEKYSIPDSRKRKLRKPLAKLLEKRAPKVSPELAFMVFAVALYSPQLIKAYGVRREKMRLKKDAGEAKPMRVPSQDVPSSPMTPPPPPVVTPDEANEYDELIREMRSKGNEKTAPANEPKVQAKPPAPTPAKRKPGRPKGSKDTKPRASRKPAAKPKTTKGRTSAKKA